MIGSVSDAQAQMLAAEKGRRKRAQREREAADRTGQPGGEAPGLTAAHDAAEAEMAAGDDRAAKAMTGQGVEAGPGTFTEPGTIESQQFRRPYIHDGHAAPSPLHQDPTVAPLPPQRPGVLVPVQLPGSPAVAGTGPIVQSMAQHQARATLANPQPRGQ
jgi:hypothetical protein